MKSVDIVENLRIKLTRPVGRQLYGVVGSYSALDEFAGLLCKAKDVEGNQFHEPVSVTRGILDAIPDEEFHELSASEAKMPSPTAKHVAMAFEKFLRFRMGGEGLLVLIDLEMLWAYHLEFGILRTLAADSFQVLLLLPGRLSGGRVIMYSEAAEGTYVLPDSLIAEDHLWELTD